MRRFVFRLAGHLGKTVSEILDGMDSREIAEWVAFAGIEPLAGDRGDIQAGIITSGLANCWRGANTPPLTPFDFVPKWGEENKKQSDSGWVDEIKQWARTHGAPHTPGK